MFQSTRLHSKGVAPFSLDFSVECVQDFTFRLTWVDFKTFSRYIFQLNVYRF